MTNQENFTMMKGHVNHNQKIRMRTGKIFTLKNVLAGWKLIDETGKEVFVNLTSAFDVESAIVNY